MSSFLEFSSPPSSFPFSGPECYIPWIVVIDLVQQRRVVAEERGVARDGHVCAWVVGGEHAVVVVDYHVDGAWAGGDV